MKTFAEIRNTLLDHPARSAWDKGVKDYAMDLLDNLEESITGAYIDPADLTDYAAIQAALLNGARDWDDYSYGGNALIYDGDIAAYLCTPSEFKRTRGGERNPNSRESWLDVQARALRQAADLVAGATRS